MIRQVVQNEREFQKCTKKHKVDILAKTIKYILKEGKLIYVGLMLRFERFSVFWIDLKSVNSVRVRLYEKF